MDFVERERLVSRITSGVIRLSTQHGIFYAGPPSPRMVYLANELYYEELHKLRFEQFFTEDETALVLTELGQWDEDQQRYLDTLPEEIEKWKVALYDCAFRSNEKTAIRKRLIVAKEKLAQVSAVRHSLDHLTITGSATIFKNRFLIAMGLQNENGLPVYKSPKKLLNSSDALLDQVVTAIHQSRISEAQYRELARENPWRQTWGAADKEHKLFGVPPTEYSDEQRTLTSWSSLYDSVYKHPKAPPDSVINDDDCLDGWLIKQRKEREQHQSVSAADELIKNDKIRGCNEVFVVAQNQEDAKNIHNLNSPEARARLKQRFAAVDKNGVVNEADMPDTRVNLRMQIAKLQAAAMQSGGKG